MASLFGYFKIKRLCVYLLMFFLVLLALLPIYIMIINATRSTAEINLGISLVPSTYLAANWRILTRFDIPISRGFLNSGFIAISTTILAVYFTSMSAYGLHAYQFKGRHIVWVIILIVMLLPSSLAFIGFYQSMSRLKLLDSYIPLIIPSIAGASTVFFIRQYMNSTLSADLIDAARIDGAGEFYIFNKIVLAVIKPALASQAIFIFVGSWNNFFAPFIFINSMKKYTLPMLIQLLRGNIYRTELGGIYLGIAVSIVPIMIFYSFMSRFIISGITMGSIKE